MVALKAHEADRALSRPDPGWRVILLYGPDEGLASERASQIALQALAGDTDPLRLIRFEADQIGADPMRLVDEANTIGLFGGERVIRVSGTTRRHQGVAAALEAVLKQPPRDALIILEAGDVPRRNALVGLCEKSPHAVTLPCYLDGPREIAGLIDRLTREAQVGIDPDARGVLASLLGGDRQMTRHEIEKLILFAGPGGRIAQTDVVTLIGDSADREAETAVTAAFLGQLGPLDAALAKLQGEAADPGYILGTALRQGFDLMPLAILSDSGANPDEVKRKLPGNLPFTRKAEMEQMLQRWPLLRLQQAIQLIGEAQAQSRKEAALARALMSRALWSVARLASASGARSVRSA